MYSLQIVKREKTKNLQKKLSFLVVTCNTLSKMNCLIESVIRKAVKSRKNIAVMQRYLRLKYRISIPAELLQSRIKASQSQAA